MDLAALLICLAGVPAGIAWERWHRRRDKTIEKRKRCAHSWGNPVWDFGQYWHRYCRSCGGQQHGRKEPDGTMHWADHVS